MSTTIKQTESLPTTGYPPIGTILYKDTIWQRVEPYICWRWSARAVIWIVEGSGDTGDEWHPPLTPTTISTVESWNPATGTWSAITLLPSPLGGYQLIDFGPYRFTGTVGVDGAAVPFGVQEAVKRLDAYLAQKFGKPGVSMESINLGGDLQQTIRRSPTAIAEAMQNSGAADLLRNYRRI